MAWFWWRKPESRKHLVISYMHTCKGGSWSTNTFHIDDLDGAKSIARDYVANPDIQFVHLYLVVDGVRTKEIDFQ